MAAIPPVVVTAPPALVPVTVIHQKNIKNIIFVMARKCGIINDTK